MLGQQEEYMLAKRWRGYADRDAAHRLVTNHLRLVTKIARDYRGYELPISDLIAEGNIGLLQAVERFAPEKASGSPPVPRGGSRPQSRSTSCALGRW
jgi:RNA polymerase sigma-32 factor